MKFALVAIVTLFSTSAFAADPTPQQMNACRKKVAAAIATTARALGMGKDVTSLGQLEVVKDRTQNGITVVTLDGGPLTTPKTEGYLSYTGAAADVIFDGTSCKIDELTVSTGAQQQAEIDAALAAEVNKTK